MCKFPHTAFLTGVCQPPAPGLRLPGPGRRGEGEKETVRERERKAGEGSEEDTERGGGEDWQKETGAFNPTIVRAFSNSSRFPLNLDGFIL